uniref:ATP-dependent Clp protease proteolytic subunit n=6 Tax=Ephedra TaxID=3387 RepID=A0A8F4TJK0_EPHVI|nr:ATP-dependent Clp protease proteolytic subunit [Ephedra funerea]YP_010453336.1 ATP-dependent Clp protease proteolytic subunit [Ephedra nevadensis]YP_010453738.1 ATP-dependent Clp protease proteolytic subunit [Ephedra torreyana]YP_010453872.1 ATP-dependent Clp protease proteolytic subunit [Ephedra trifurca]YP_010454006.1 ATP-dependent Clp protease proteolytic subunit [Ephedra viridis]QXG18973.1 ATP-dependent Clp protease proteolytic subunit [Ephedra californica]QXG17240.1 ATP-dependent Clp 
MSRTRCIFLGQPVDEDIGSIFVGILLYLFIDDIRKGKSRQIFMYINSCGGAILPGLSIFDIMLQLRETIHTIGLGLVASTATLVLSAGTFGFRNTGPHSRIMIHQPRASLRDGPAWLFAKDAFFVQQLRKMIVQCYCLRTPQFEELIENALDKNTYMSPEEAVDFGLVDRIALPMWEPNKEEPPFEIPEEGNEGFGLIPNHVLEEARRARKIRSTKGAVQIEQNLSLQFDE